MQGTSSPRRGTGAGAGGFLSVPAGGAGDDEARSSGGEAGLNTLLASDNVNELRVHLLQDHVAGNVNLSNVRKEYND
jgi:hypothetical protein